MKISLLSADHKLIDSMEGTGSVELSLNHTYEPGDKLIFEFAGFNFVNITISSKMTPAMIYSTRGELIYTIPFGEKLDAYHPETFSGENHQISLSIVDECDIYTRRNLALNPLSIRHQEVCYPYSDANIVTRNESVFESRNAIDGYKDTDGHGKFPFQSWGGGLRDDLEFRLYFGREVEIDEVVLYLRADYKDDHDINWESGVIEFSNGYKIPIEMSKVQGGQRFTFNPRKVSWIKLNNLRREISAAFSALIQIEVFGQDVKPISKH